MSHPLVSQPLFKVESGGEKSLLRIAGTTSWVDDVSYHPIMQHIEVMANLAIAALAKEHDRLQFLVEAQRLALTTLNKELTESRSALDAATKKLAVHAGKTA